MDKQKINVPEKQLQLIPFSKKEFHEDTIKRLELISKEFSDGFNFLQDFRKSVTFFGGSHFKENNKYYIKAREMSRRIVNELKYTIVTGGGPGIMEAANRGAFEAGGESIGLTIELPNEQIQNPFLTKNLNFYHFFSRKVCLTFSAEAYVFFPGGYGTMDEFFEIITLIQTKKLEKVPIILVGSDFWNSMDNLIREEMLSREVIDMEDLQLYTITDDEDQIIEIIKEAPIHETVRFNHDELKKSGINIE